jgi:hypothetical protein
MLRWRGTITAAAECHLMTVFLQSKVWKMIYIPQLSFYSRRVSIMSIVFF